ncbi:MAG: ABC transporter substrate-binding protein [Bryobacterales bacterium]|nr:ABC transporter substrate-binding protein [Bryobacterales bacterium]
MIRRRDVPALLAPLVAGCPNRNARGSIRSAAPFASVSYLPILFARSLGYFDQEGLAVETEDLSSVTKVMESLVGGSIEIAGGTYEQTIQMNALGRDVTAFFVLSTRLSQILVAAPARRDVQRIGDLKTRTVGVTGFGSATHNLLNFLLLKNGLKPSDVDVVAIGNGASAIAAMENGRVAAAVMISTAFEVLRSMRPDVIVLADTRTPEGSTELFGVPRLAASALMATNFWLSKHPSEARGVTRAVASAARWIREHPVEEVYAKLPESLQTPGSDAGKRALLMMMPAFSVDGRMPSGAPGTIRDFLRLAVDPSLNVDLANTYTNEYLEANP